MIRQIAALAAVCVAAVCGCAQQAPQPPGPLVDQVRPLTPAFDGASPLPPPDFTGDGPGSLIEVTPYDSNVDLADADATVFRVVYRSTSATGEPTEVSGVVAIPPGLPPRGGWPVISWGHGTSGVLNKCAPSKFDNLLGNGPILAALINNGFLVAMSDFEGLGVPGFRHPYLNSQTFGNNMIDAVRAARKIDPSASDQWVSFGVSLGGMAAWGAADRAGEYGGGLDLVGTAAVVPIANMSGLVDSAMDGTLTRDQLPLLAWTLQGLAWSNDDFELSDYVSGYTAEHWDDVLECIPPDPDFTERVRANMRPSDLRPATEAAANRLRDLLTGMGLPQHQTTGPVLVQYGTEDPLVNYQWTQNALAAACENGSFIEFEERIGEAHADIDSGRVLPWIKARFAGERPVSTCGGRS